MRPAVLKPYTYTEEQYRQHVDSFTTQQKQALWLNYVVTQYYCKHVYGMPLLEPLDFVEFTTGDHMYNIYGWYYRKENQIKW